MSIIQHVEGGGIRLSQPVFFPRFGSRGEVAFSRVCLPNQNIVQWRTALSHANKGLTALAYVFRHGCPRAIGRLTTMRFRDIAMCLYNVPVSPCAIIECESTVVLAYERQVSGTVE